MAFIDTKFLFGLKVESPLASKGDALSESSLKFELPGENPQEDKSNAFQPKIEVKTHCVTIKKDSLEPSVETPQVRQEPLETNSCEANVFASSQNPFPIQPASDIVEIVQNETTDFLEGPQSIIAEETIAKENSKAQVLELSTAVKQQTILSSKGTILESKKGTLDSEEPLLIEGKPQDIQITEQENITEDFFFKEKNTFVKEFYPKISSEEIFTTNKKGDFEQPSYSIAKEENQKLVMAQKEESINHRGINTEKPSLNKNTLEIPFSNKVYKVTSDDSGSTIQDVEKEINRGQVHNELTQLNHKTSIYSAHKTVTSLLSNKVENPGTTESLISGLYSNDTFSSSTYTQTISKGIDVRATTDTRKKEGNKATLQDEGAKTDSLETKPAPAEIIKRLKPLNSNSALHRLSQQSLSLKESRTNKNEEASNNKLGIQTTENTAKPSVMASPEQRAISVSVTTNTTKLADNSASAATAEIVSVIMQNIERLRKSSQPNLKVALNLPNEKSLILHLNIVGNKKINVRFDTESETIRNALEQGWYTLVNQASQAGINLTQPVFSNTKNLGALLPQSRTLHFA